MRIITSSLRGQLLAGFAAVTVVFAIGVVVSISSLSSVTSTLRAGTTRARMADQLSIDTYNMQGSQLMNALLGTRVAAADHAGDVQQFHTDLAAMGHELRTPADHRAYQELARAYAAWVTVNARADRLSAAHDPGTNALVTGAANPATDTLSTAAGNLGTLIAAEDAREAGSSKSSATLTALLFGLVGILLAVGIVQLLSRRIVGGVRQMLKAASALSRGEVDQHIAVSGHDEVGQMAQRFADLIDYLRVTAGAAEELAQGNFAVEIAPRGERDALSHAFIEMRDRVGTVVRAISGTSRTLNSSSVEMASSTEEVGRAITEIADSVGSVASGAEEQVRAVEQAREMSEEVAEVSRASAQTAAETAQAAAEARASAEIGAQAVERVDDAMRGVQNSSAQVDAAMRALGEKSSRIGGIVDAITAIAEQTNLLALNAAIEAARAGEQGRGFAVVAEEVRKLAEESQAAAASIADLVSEISAETDRAILVVEHGVKQTDDGARTVLEARQAFQQIRSNVELMTERIEEIAGSSVQIANSALKMQESVTSVAAVAEQSSASTEEVSAAT